MQRIGIRALKEQASEILRQVREDGDSFEVTYRGRAIARVVPVTELKPGAERSSFWDRWQELSEAVSADWPAGVSAADAVCQDRREL
jgi:prevent-host-death family protein